MNWRKKLGEPQAYLYCLPALVPYTIFWLAPMGYVMYLSFMEWDFINPVKEFVGIENYVKLFQDQKFYKALRVSLLFALGNVIPCLAGGLLLALLLYESAFQRFEVGEASSVAVVMIVILAIISSLSMYVSRRRIHYV